MQKYGTKFKFAWSSRGVSLALQVVLLGYLTYYCTDVAGLSPTLTGTILLASKIFDGFTDLVVGFLIDRTHTRWGKARPYQAFILPCWIFTVLLFTIPRIGTAAKAVYLFLIYTIVNSVFATFLNGSDALYLSKAVKGEQNRVSVTGFNGIMVMISCVIFSIIMPQLIKFMGTDQLRWSLVIGILGVVLGLLGMFRFWYCKELSDAVEEQKAEAEEKLSVGKSVHALFQNKYALMLTLLVLLSSLSSNIGTAANTYYFKYIMGDVGLASIVGMASLVTPIAIILYTPLSKKLGSVGFMRLGFLVALIGFAIRSLGGANMVPLMIGTILNLMGTVSLTCFVNIYSVDCMTYGKKKTGQNVEGLISSVTAFGNKVGGSAASGIVGLMMGVAGYNGALEVQSASANHAIVFLFNYLPLILIAAMFIITLFYHIDRDLKEMQ